MKINIGVEGVLLLDRLKNNTNRKKLNPVKTLGIYLNFLIQVSAMPSLVYLAVSLIPGNKKQIRRKTNH